jgi:hypothetical protein
VDELQLIVGQAVPQGANDQRRLKPMTTTIEQQCGDTTTQLFTDASSCSDENLAAIGFVPPARSLAWRSRTRTPTQHA